MEYSDYVIKGETEEDLLKNGAEHATQVHGMNADDIYVAPFCYLMRLYYIFIWFLDIILCTLVHPRGITTPWMEIQIQNIL